MNTPAAETDVDDDLVRRLIRLQHPDLEGPLTLVANGWDNVVYRLGEDRPAPPDAPRNPVRGVPLAARDQVVRQRLSSIPRSAGLLPLWERLAALPPWQGPALWLRGDPHPGNLLIGGDGLAAVGDHVLHQVTLP
ncbi:hypothetical protein [Streptosporangium sp. NPDC049376]|uniref:hypothetical protein n=1 Tax=Streptosporangium sp. NPDC049376 TaxID=3366192 RepID=UPI0037AF48D0